MAKKKKKPAAKHWGNPINIGDYLSKDDPASKINRAISDNIRKKEDSGHNSNYGNKRNTSVNPRPIHNEPQRPARQGGIDMSNPRVAKAPYNFIPLNSDVVGSDREKNQRNDRDTFDHNSGYIDCTLKTLTPLYIRDTFTREEIERNLKINPNFFSPGGIFRIPGSSLRGMTRTLVEIVSWSKFGFTDEERKYHFRSFADASLDLRKEYEHMNTQIQGGFCPDPKYVKAGILKKINNKYCLYPSVTINHDNTQFYKVEENDVINAGLCFEEMRIQRSKPDGRPYNVPNNRYEMGFKKVWFKAASPKTHRNHSKPMYYGKVTNIQIRTNNIPPPESPGWHKGFLVLSGWMPGGNLGKHLHWVVNEGGSSNLEVSENVINNYEKDENRTDKEGADLLKSLEKSKDGVPCFYITDNEGNVSSFGHTAMFRLAYNKSVGNLIEPIDHKNDNLIDIAESIFGRQPEKKNKVKALGLAGRVYFEDAFLIGNNENIYENNGNPLHPKILSEPKPTTFQHYLEQTKNDLKYECRDRNRNQRRIGLNDTIPGGYNLKTVSGLKNYNSSGAKIRGNKLYWHRKTGNAWKETDLRNVQSAPKQYTKITPVKSGTNFRFRIRFENLTNIELGALLFALQLPNPAGYDHNNPDYAHKLGMAKPLGLGSVLIEPELTIINRKARYEKLFYDNGSWFEGKEKADACGVKSFKDEFSKYILESTQKDNGTINPSEKNHGEVLWSTRRLLELEKMLSFREAPHQANTLYMKIDDYVPQVGKNAFKIRPVLCDPTDYR